MSNTAWLILLGVAFLCYILLRIYDKMKWRDSRDTVLSEIDYEIRDLKQIKYQYKRYLKLKKKNDANADLVMNMAYSICRDLEEDEVPWLELYLKNAYDGKPRYIKNVRRIRQNWKHFFVDYYE